MKKQSGKTKVGFRAVCEQAHEAITRLMWHPDCPPSVREELAATFCEIANRASDTNDEREKFDVRLAFAALANGPLAE